MPNSTKPFLGAVFAKNTTDNDAVFMIPAASIMPRSPENVGYPAVMNVSSYPSVAVLGQRTPFFTLSACAKASWFTAAFVNDLLFEIGTSAIAENYQNTDAWDFCAWDGSLLDYHAGANGRRIFEGCRCSSLTVRMGTQGPVMVDMTFLARYGDEVPVSSIPPLTNNAAFGTAIAAAVPDAGMVYGVRDINFTTVTHIPSFSFTLNRGQGHLGFLDGQGYPVGVASGMFSGSAALEQSPTGVTTSLNLTVDLGASTTGIRFAMVLNLDEKASDMNIGFGRVIRQFTMVKLSDGGNPCLVTARP